LSSQMMLPRYLMNGLNSFGKTDREYLLAPSDDPIRCWRSEVKEQGHILVKVHCGKGIDVNAEPSTSSSTGLFLSYSWLINAYGIMERENLERAFTVSVPL